MVQRMIALSGLVFMVPAVLVNVESGMASGRSMAHMTAAIAMVIGAGLSGMILGKALRDNAYSVGLISALVLVALTLMNVANALGLASHDRSARRSEAGAAVAKVQRLEDQKRTLEDMISTRSNISSSQSAASLQAESDAKKLQLVYARSKSCADVTLPDSRIFCGELFALDAKLSAARDVEKAQADLAVVISKLNVMTMAPESLDPQAENVIAFMPWSVEAKSVGLAINGWWALCIEMMASVMPGLVAFLARPATSQATHGNAGTGNRPHREDTELAPRKPEQLEQAAKPRAPLKIAPSLESFLVGLMKRTGGVTSAADLLAAYCRHCQELGVLPETQRALGMAMTAAGYAKETRGTVRYVGVVMRHAKPALVAVK